MKLRRRWLDKQCLESVENASGWSFPRWMRVQQPFSCIAMSCDCTCLFTHDCKYSHCNPIITIWCTHLPVLTCSGVRGSNRMLDGKYWWLDWPSKMLAHSLSLSHTHPHAHSERNVVCTMSGSGGQISLSVIVLMHSAPIAAAVLLTLARFMALQEPTAGTKMGGFGAAKVTVLKRKRGRSTLSDIRCLSMRLCTRRSPVAGFIVRTVIRKNWMPSHNSCDEEKTLGNTQTQFLNPIRVFALFDQLQLKKKTKKKLELKTISHVLYFYMNI